ncbi:MAG: ABC transporter permease [Spirochaetota bacterium]
MVKENRLVSGEPASLVSLSFPAFLVVVLLLVAMAVLSGVSLKYGTSNGTTGRKGAGRPAAENPVPASSMALLPAVMLFCVIWLAVGVSGTALLEVQGFDRGRISPASGFWFLLLAVLIVLSHGMKSLRSTGTGSVLSLGLVAFVVIIFFAGVLDDIAFVQEYYTRESRFFTELAAHAGLAGSSVAAAVVVGIPIGILAFRFKRLERPLFSLVNGLQTIPSLALFGLMIAPLALLSQQYPILRSLGVRGVGNTPAFLALFLYALLPVVRNTYTSLSVLDPAVVDAGTGMGMTRKQLLWQVEFPISLPIILSGIRVSAVQTIGNTTVAALIGAGGLGNFVFQGLGQAAPDLIVMGVIPIILLAVLTDRVFQFILDNAVPGPSRRRVAYD